MRCPGPADWPGVRAEAGSVVAKVRVYELAKEFGVESKAVMAKLQEMGEFVRSASSTIEAPVVRRLKEAFAGQQAKAQAGKAQAGKGPQLAAVADSTQGANGRSPSAPAMPAAPAAQAPVETQDHPGAQPAPGPVAAPAAGAPAAGAPASPVSE